MLCGKMSSCVIECEQRLIAHSAKHHRLKDGLVLHVKRKLPTFAQERRAWLHICLVRRALYC